MWELSDIIIGENYVFTPTEVFVLGGSILLHDLGMSLSSYPNGLNELINNPKWKDIITVEYKTKFNRYPNEEEINDPLEDIKINAISTMLRNLHAEHAQELAFTQWKIKNKTPVYLIDDIEIRNTFGRLIGLIAHSHWWSIEKLENVFKKIVGPPHWCPNEWIVNPLKLACLLRVADISHIDARRAPSFLRILRKIPAYSDEHWMFQEKLHKPILNGDALEFTSGHAFTFDEANSWWLCLDTLSMIDDELRKVDALLADKKLHRFAARRVAGIDSPERLTLYIPTDGWMPIDSIIHVTDVPMLIKNLGGEELYGKNPKVALRELIQNSADAIKIRRILEKRDNNWGEIRVRLGKNETGYYLEVEDNGIGMSSEVLIHYLLDFGSSYWTSNQMINDFPGLLSSGFEATGKYGIGFFSIFMLGDRIKIQTRRADAALNDTLVLEFNTGYCKRPIIRKASKVEQIIDGGTIIRVELHKKPLEKGGLLYRDKPAFPYNLDQLCKELCPSLDVNVVTIYDDKVKYSILSNDWIKMDGVELLQKINDWDEYRIGTLNKETYTKFLSKVSKNLTCLEDDNGKKLGRACIVHDLNLSWYDPNLPRIRGCVTVGGLESCSLNGIAGILIGESERTSREIAKPVVNKNMLSKWATHQAEIVPKLYSEVYAQISCANIIRRCGGDTKNLPISFFQNKYLSYNDVFNLKSFPSELYLADPLFLQIAGVQKLKNFRIQPNVIIVSFLSQPIIWGARNDSKWPMDLISPWNNDDDLLYFQTSLGGAILEACAKVWKVPIEDVIKVSEIDEKFDRQEVIGYVNNDEIRQFVFTIRKPE